MYTPVEIKKILDEHVLGQEDAKKAVSVLYYSHFNKHVRQNLLLIGPSGSGKTELFRQLNQIEPDKHTIYIYDASNITNDGWSGKKKFDSVFKQMFAEGWTEDEIENAIIVFDEFDKLTAPRFNSAHENVSSSIQGELLSMIEGTSLVVAVPDMANDPVIDTSKISFVFLGAFEDLYKKKKEEANRHVIGFSKSKEEKESKENINFDFDDIINFGIRTELAGRIARMVVLYSLDENDFYSIMMDPVMSPIAKLAVQYKTHISIQTDVIKDLASKAVENGMGVRFLHGKILDAVSDEIYEAGSSKLLTLSTSSKTINSETKENTDYFL